MLESQPSVLEVAPVGDLSKTLLGCPRTLRRSLKFERDPSMEVCKEFVIRSLVVPRRFHSTGFILVWQETTSFSLGFDE